MNGWIKDYRQELSSDIWNMPPIYHRVWQYLKYTVNHQPRTVPSKDGDIFIDKGQTITSYQQIADGCGWYEWGVKRTPNKKTIKTVLEWLQRSEMVKVESNARGTRITLCNYGIYQVQEVAKVTQKKRSLDTNKKDKNVQEERVHARAGFSHEHSPSDLSLAIARKTITFEEDGE